MHRLAMTMAAAGLFASSAMAVELNTAAVTYKGPEDIDWKAPSSNAGVRQAVVVGDPSKPGLYVQLTKWLPGNMSRPHFHNNDRYFIVVKGTW